MNRYKLHRKLFPVEHNVFLKPLASFRWLPTNYLQLERKGVFVPRGTQVPACRLETGLHPLSERPFSVCSYHPTLGRDGVGGGTTNSMVPRRWPLSSMPSLLGQVHFFTSKLPAQTLPLQSQSRAVPSPWQAEGTQSYPNTRPDLCMRVWITDGAGR